LVQLLLLFLAVARR